ncbi:hypothetical protein PanWU01x14_053970, partial [Parasponia andersonii]
SCDATLGRKASPQALQFGLELQSFLSCLTTRSRVAMLPFGPCGMTSGCGASLGSYNAALGRKASFEYCRAGSKCRAFPWVL